MKATLTESMPKYITADRENNSRTENLTVYTFDQVYISFGDAIYTYLRHQTSDKDVANDLFQDVMMKILRNLKSFKMQGSIEAWVITISRNCLRDFQRKKNRWSKILFSRDIQEVQETRLQTTNVLPFESPDQKLEVMEIQNRISNAILSLPEDQREVIDFHYYFGLSFRQISEILDCSINTTASRARYGLKKLKKLLEV